MSRVLITGCSTGIGRASAIELTKRGFEVVATARRLETLEDLDVADKLALDVDDGASVAAVKAKAGDIDVLVNNAGRGIHAPVEGLPIEEFRGLLETNADAVEGKEAKLRWPVGNDAKMVIDTRESMSFEQFEATMREFLKLDW